MKKVLLTKNIKNLRDAWLLQDGYIDPILGIKIKNPTLDHNHQNGYCRKVLDRDSNQFLGVLESGFKRFVKHRGFKDEDLPIILQNIVKYLSTNHENLEILHPKSIDLLVKRFSRFNLNNQEIELLTLGLSTKEVQKTKQQRTKQYRKLLLNEKNVLKFN